MCSGGGIMCPCAHSIYIHIYIYIHVYIYIYIYIYIHVYITFLSLSLLALRLACFLDPRRAAGEPESIFAIHSSPGGHTSFSSFDGNPRRVRSERQPGRLSLAECAHLLLRGNASAARSLRVPNVPPGPSAAGVSLETASWSSRCISKERLRTEVETLSGNSRA